MRGVRILWEEACWCLCQAKEAYAGGEETAQEQTGENLDVLSRLETLVGAEQARANKKASNAAFLILQKTLSTC